jgi:hypothetical protein
LWFWPAVIEGLHHRHSREHDPCVGFCGFEQHLDGELSVIGLLIRLR